MSCKPLLTTPKGHTATTQRDSKWPLNFHTQALLKEFYWMKYALKVHSTTKSFSKQVKLSITTELPLYREIAATSKVMKSFKRTSSSIIHFITLFQSKMRTIQRITLWPRSLNSYSLHTITAMTGRDKKPKSTWVPCWCIWLKEERNKNASSTISLIRRTATHLTLHNQWPTMANQEPKEYHYKDSP